MIANSSAIMRPQTRRRSLTARRVILTLLTIGLLAWIGWWGCKQVAWWTPPGQDIARVVRGAAAANTTLLTPPQAYRNVPITAAEMAALSRTAQRKLAAYYSGDLLATKQSIARETLDPKSLHRGKNTDWMTWWRVDWVHLGELTLLPGSATATAGAEFRSNLNAINRIGYTFHLLNTHSGWRIDREESSFQPGYGP